MRETFIREKMPPYAPAVTQIPQQSVASCCLGEQPWQSMPERLEIRWRYEGHRKVDLQAARGKRCDSPWLYSPPALENL